VLFGAAGLPAAAATQAAALLDPAEQAWVAAHPVIRVTSDATLPPLEYLRDGQLKGLSGDYLQLISARTGLHFQFVQAADWPAAQRAVQSRQADMLLNAMDERLSPATRAAVRLGRPYLSAYSVVFTRAESPAVWDLQELAGRRVAARAAGDYARILQARYPQLVVVPTDTPQASMQLVLDGQADAAMGTNATFQPFVARRYLDELHISRPRIDLVMQAQFAVRSDWPQLEAIIGKAMASISTQQESQIRQQWLREEDYGAPSVATVLRYNWPWLLAIGLLVLALGVVARWAWRARASAIESERVKARFLATMSHEIRTPINAVLGAIEVLADHVPAGRPRALVRAAEEAAESLTGLLDNVLDLSKLDEGRMQLEKIPVDVRALGRSVAAVFQGELEKRGIALLVEVPANDTWLMLDPTRLRQVLMNLLGNARKFTRRGSVRLSLQVRAQGADTWLHAAVSDTGCGIPAALQAHLFDPYTQADGSISRQYGGTGLGLSISHDLVQLMGGQIDLHSVEGEGTTVSLRIPAAPADAVAAPAAATPGSVLRGVRVLVVDDHAPNRMVLEEQLARLGAVATLADSAAQALEAVTAGLPDIVLLDCFMPDIDGYQASRMIRATGVPGVADLPIIAISAATDAAHLARCQQAGMNGVLKKPIRLAELQGMLALWTGRAGSAASAAGPQEAVADALEAIERETVDRLGPDLRVLLADDLRKLRDAVDASDIGRLTFYAHRLHGAAGLVGRPALAALAARLEADPEMDPDQALDEIDEQLESLSRAAPIRV
jgi:signal transduction histidine kinase/response regulator of citrate/malate metabolism